MEAKAVLPILLALLSSALLAAGVFAALWLRARRRAARSDAAYAEAERERRLLDESIETLPCNFAVYDAGGGGPRAVRGEAGGPGGSGLLRCRHDA